MSAYRTYLDPRPVYRRRFAPMLSAQLPHRIARFGAALLCVALTFAASAQPKVDSTRLSTQSGTVLSYLEAHSSNTSGIACYSQGRTPDQSFNCLLQVIRTAGLEDVFSADEKITVFAPTDTAFRALASLVSAKTFSALLRDPARLKTLLEASMVPGRLALPDLSRRASGATGKATLDTVGGAELPIAFRRFDARTNTTISVGEARSRKWQAYVSDRAIVLTNGVIVPISMVLLPTTVLPE